jgi:hypothetical protein
LSDFLYERLFTFLPYDNNTILTPHPVSRVMMFLYPERDTDAL